jgi:hypothetical protein
MDGRISTESPGSMNDSSSPFSTEASTVETRRLPL